MISRGTTAPSPLSQPWIASHNVMWSCTPTVTIRSCPLDVETEPPEIWMTSLLWSVPNVFQVGPGVSATYGTVTPSNAATIRSNRTIAPTSRVAPRRLTPESLLGNTDTLSSPVGEHRARDDAPTRRVPWDACLT